MNVPLDEDQRELLKLTRRLLEEHASEDHLRRRMNLDAAHDPDLWRRLADLGLISLVLDERWGGVGLGEHVLAPVLHLLGEFAVPEPFLETVVAALLIQEACPEEFAAAWLPRIASGDAVVALSFGARTPVVPYAASADLVLVCDGGVAAVETAPNGPGGAGSGPEGSEGWVGGTTTASSAKPPGGLGRGAIGGRTARRRGSCLGVWGGRWRR
ncbi:acyl-CoA dehydrogenase family protein [Acrocarpospora catenulata]|uniref:acyl-CoA dehydrogenase family protein n=1 Tax=Acrocarpospora catenulata TaxID=2836182 RepID=UPI001BD9DC85|nr:acyl-CoA dehydrogenase family protein [Acrocarpospora catenulata]